MMWCPTSEAAKHISMPSTVRSSRLGTIPAFSNTTSNERPRATNSAAALRDDSMTPTSTTRVSNTSAPVRSRSSFAAARPCSRCGRRA